MPSPMCSTWLCVFPLEEVHVCLWMFRCGTIVLLTSRFLDVAKFASLTPLLLLAWWRLSFLIVSFKISSLSSFLLTSRNRTFVQYWGKWLKPALVLHKYSQFSPHTRCMHIKKNVITLATSQNYIWHLSLTKSTLVNADNILWCTNFLFPFEDFLFHRKNIIPWSYSVPCPTWPSVHPLNLTYTLLIHWLLL
jgi:hypothetical protein